MIEAMQGGEELQARTVSHLKGTSYCKWAPFLRSQMEIIAHTIEQHASESCTEGKGKKWEWAGALPADSLCLCAEEAHGRVFSSLRSIVNGEHPQQAPALGSSALLKTLQIQDTENMSII